mgnify:CR=1 FL=1|jgi:hypothetical protein
MDKRPNIKKRIALELFRSIKKNRAKLHELRLSQNKLEMASVVLFQVEVFWIFL